MSRRRATNGDSIVVLSRSSAGSNIRPAALLYQLQWLCALAPGVGASVETVIKKAGIVVHPFCSWAGGVGVGSYKGKVAFSSKGMIIGQGLEVLCVFLCSKN